MKLLMLIFPGYEVFVTPVAFVGAMLAAVCIYILAWKNGIRPVRIILADVAVSAFLGAGISGMMIFNSDKIHNALMWMVGGLMALLASRHINILQLGDEVAKGLGVRVELTRIVLTAIAALLAASAVSVVGLLGFVGLIVPHAARLIVGSDYRFLLPASALLGIGVVTIYTAGAPDKVMNETFLKEVFGVRAEVFSNDRGEQILTPVEVLR